jgi:hypothetical protein
VSSLPEVQIVSPEDKTLVSRHTHRNFVFSGFMISITENQKIEVQTIVAAKLAAAFLKQLILQLREQLTIDNESER